MGVSAGSPHPDRLFQTKKSYFPHPAFSLRYKLNRMGERIQPCMTSLQ